MTIFNTISVCSLATELKMYIKTDLINLTMTKTQITPSSQFKPINNSWKKTHTDYHQTKIPFEQLKKEEE